jgi:ankyrin repeat protein
MDFSCEEMNDAIGLGLVGFKAFIQKKLSENENFLDQFFWLQEDGSQINVVNYLIQAHKEPKDGEPDGGSGTDLTQLIDHVLDLSRDKNNGEPLHQAIATGKLQLALHLLTAEQNKVNKDVVLSVIKLFEQEGQKDRSIKYQVDRRDNKGRTLLYLVLRSLNLDLLITILLGNPNIHAATHMTNHRVMFQPIHQAVLLDFADGVRLLTHLGAPLDNPVGANKDTPLLLAARLGSINAMEALLESPLDKLMLTDKNNNLFEDNHKGHAAIEELCDRIYNNNNKDEAIRGVAMLLCRGFEPPSREEMRQLLSSNRIDLLKAIHNYLEDKPALVDAFVERCHLIEGPLHNIVYADHSWGSSIRHLFGKPSDAAFMIEKLVARKYENPQADPHNEIPLSTAAAESLGKEKNTLKLYAEFVRRYTQAYDNQLFTNSWSTMRWMIAEGRCDWDGVVSYAKNHPRSRTSIIYKDMSLSVTRIHEDLGGAVPEDSVTHLTPH